MAEALMIGAVRDLRAALVGLQEGNHEWQLPPI